MLSSGGEANEGLRPAGLPHRRAPLLIVLLIPLLACLGTATAAQGRYGLRGPAPSRALRTAKEGRNQAVTCWGIRRLPRARRRPEGVRPASCGFKFITAATALTFKDPLFRAQSYKGAPRFQAKLLIFKLIGPFLWCRPMMKMKLEGRGAPL